MNNPSLVPQSESWLLLLIDAIRHHWLMIAVCALLATVAGAYFALTSPQIYRTHTVLMATNGIEKNSSVLDSLGGLAGFVGGGAQSNNKLEALAILRSREFTQRFIEQNKLRPILFAERYDAAREQWLSGREPSDYEAYELFDREIRLIQEDLSQGTVTLAIEWTDRQLAAQWANALASDLNQTVRNRAIEKYSETLEYLYAELAKNSEGGIRAGIYNLIEENTRSIALANVQKEFAFTVIDAAAAPDEQSYVRPKRVLLVATGLLLGLTAGVLLALLRRTLARSHPARNRP